MKLISTVRAGPVAQSRPAPIQVEGTLLYDKIPFSHANSTVQNYRQLRYDPLALIREMAHVEGPFSTAVHNMVETGNTYLQLAAYKVGTNAYDQVGTNLAQSIVSSFDTLHDFNGYSNRASFPMLTTMLQREALLMGRCATELVLNKARLPEYMQAIGADTLQAVSDGKGGWYPAQRTYKNQQGAVPGYVPLNIPTFFMADVHPDPNAIAPRSVMESAIKLLIYFDEYMEDIRRSVRQSGHTRIALTLDSDKVRAAAPLSIAADPQLLQQYFNQVRVAVEDNLRQINPEDALVMYDSITASTLDAKQGSSLDYTPLLNVISALLATSLKTPPSVLGLQLDNGAQGSDNVATLIFLKTIQALHTPVEMVLSRALTLGCRLHGSNVYVKATYDPPELRPTTELESFQTMRQTRILQQLSLGLITDDYAAMLLRTGPRPAGAKDLSGTMFLDGGAGQAQNSGFPGDTSMGRTLQPPKKVPRKAGGKSQ